MEPDQLLQFFRFSHLPPALAEISKPFAKQAIDMHDRLPRNAERTTMLRNLLTAKDNAVRAHLTRTFTAEDLATLRLEANDCGC